jgi:hypothetical protein
MMVTSLQNCRFMKRSLCHKAAGCPDLLFSAPPFHCISLIICRLQSIAHGQTLRSNRGHWFFLFADPDGTRWTAMPRLKILRDPGRIFQPARLVQIPHKVFALEQLVRLLPDDECPPGAHKRSGPFSLSHKPATGTCFFAGNVEATQLILIGNSCRKANPSSYSREEG